MGVSHEAENLAADGDLHLREDSDPGFDFRPDGSSPNRANDRSVKSANGTPDRGINPDRARHRSSRRRWVSAFIKWFMLLSSLVVIGYGLWSWTMRSPPNPNHNFAEVQIVDLEEFLKKATKMMQVQLELLDMKIGVQMEGLRKQLEESTAKQTAAFYTKLRDLKVQTSEIESSLLNLRDMELLMKEEAVDLVNHIVHARAGKGEGQALCLDEASGSGNTETCRTWVGDRG